MKTATFLTLAAVLGSTLAAPQAPNGTTAGVKGTSPKTKNPLDALLDDLVIAPGPAPKGCAPYEIIVARGTSEFGAFGFLVGDALVKNVQKALPQARGYAVNYPANTAKDSIPIGVKDIQNRLTTKFAECPDMKYALSGYSQGASVMRAAFQNWTTPAGLQEKIVALVMFGDPGLNGRDVLHEKPADEDPMLQAFPKLLYGRLREWCNKGDPVCSIGTNFMAHLGYSSAAVTSAAANFVIQAFKGTPLPAKQDGSF